MASACLDNYRKRQEVGQVGCDQWRMPVLINPRECGRSGEMAEVSGTCIS